MDSGSFDSWSLNSLGSSEHSVNVSLWDFYDLYDSDQSEKIKQTQSEQSEDLT